MRSPDLAAWRDVRGVIFDLDGTLVDSQLDFTEIRDTLGCPDGVGVLEYIDGLPVAEQARARSAVLAFEQRGAEVAVWMPGAREFLHWLVAQGLPTAILTRNARSVAELTVKRLGMPVPLVLAREDAPPKPAPDGLLHIARQWQLPPASCVYIGDFRYDLEAAHNAGMIACYYDPQGSGDFAAQAHWHVRHFEQLMLA